MAKNTIILHLDWKVFLDVLPDDELGQWTRAVMDYMETGEPPKNMSKAVEVAFYAAFERIGRDREKWEANGGSSERKREAGRLGGMKSGEARRAKSEAAKQRSKTKQNEAVSCNPVSCNPVPVSSSSDDSAADAATMTTMTAELAKMYEAHIGEATDYIQIGIRQAVQDLGPELAKAIMETCIDNGAKKWAYLRAAYTKAKAQGITTVEAYQGGHMRAKGAIVDRATPSGNNILARGIGRPLRLKREE